MTTILIFKRLDVLSNEILCTNILHIYIGRCWEIKKTSSWTHSSIIQKQSCVSVHCHRLEKSSILFPIERLEFESLSGFSTQARSFPSYFRYSVMDSHRHLTRLWGTKPLSHRPSWPIEDVLSFLLEHKTSRFLQRKNKQTAVTSSFGRHHYNFFLKNFVLRG